MIRDDLFVRVMEVYPRKLNDNGVFSSDGDEERDGLLKESAVWEH